MQFRFPQFVPTPLAQIVQSASPEAVQLMQVKMPPPLADVAASVAVAFAVAADDGDSDAYIIGLLCFSSIIFFVGLIDVYRI